MTYATLSMTPYQTLARRVLDESQPFLDRLLAWENLNSRADEIGRDWNGLSDHARSRILGAMALDISAFGFVTAEQSESV